jgi:hypothetical protein
MKKIIIFCFACFNLFGMISLYFFIQHERGAGKMMFLLSLSSLIYCLIAVYMKKKQIKLW